MNKKTDLTCEQIVDLLKKELGPAFKDARIETRSEGLKKLAMHLAWVTIDKAFLKKAVAVLKTVDYPFMAVISGCDTGDAVELLYHLFVYNGVPNREISITLKVPVPKTDLTVDTIADLLPGAVFSEREKQEFFGVKVVGIPDDRRLFLPEDFPKGRYPWRKDETGIPEDQVNKLYLAGREEAKCALNWKVKPKDEVGR